jgi:hypothetical protein
MFQAHIVEKIKTHFVRSIRFPENHAVYDLNNMVESGDTPQMKI